MIRGFERRRRILLLALGWLAGTPSPAAGAGDGDAWFGLELDIDADGVFDPVVKSIKVSGVVPGSPAASAGVMAGDVVVRMQGADVAGAKARALQRPCRVTPARPCASPFDARAATCRR